VTLKLSCRFCWTRAISTVGLAAVFLSTGAIHAIDPGGIEHYGFAGWFSYVLSAVEIVSAIALFIGFDLVRFVFLGIALTGVYLHLRYGETNLLVLPAVPLVLLATLTWANRPRPACACALRHHANG
jgi:hypothetical protein